MNDNRKYLIDEDYFEEIDSPEKAYILGFIYADGYNREDTLELTQTEPNLDIVPKIVKCLKSEHPIVSTITKNGKKKYSVYFNSKKLCSDLTKLGATKAKSLTIAFPKFISERFMSHFIRGYFDGDGCIWEGKRKKTIVKDSSRLYGERERIIHNVKFTFTGNFEFINELQNYLVETIGLSKTKLNFPRKAKETKHICTMEYSGRKNVEKLYNYMYDESQLYLEVKKTKFENIINCALDKKLSSETGLIAGTPETVISSQASNEEGSSTIPEMEVESSDSKCPALNK